MTETAGAGPADAARLDELAAVTREYAKFSRWAFGFASAALGAWLGAAAIVRVQWLRWSDVLLAFAPLGYVELLRVARAYYQRRGEVVPHEPLAGFRLASLVLIGALAAIGASSLLLQGAWASRGGPLRWAGLISGALALLVAAVRAPRCTRGAEDASTVNLLLLIVMGEIGRRSLGISPYALGGMAAFWVVSGIWQHVSFLRLERRFAALREGA